MDNVLSQCLENVYKTLKEKVLIKHFLWNIFEKHSHNILENVLSLLENVVVKHFNKT